MLFYGDSVPMEELGLSSQIVQALNTIGKPKSTAIQQKAIPKILAGGDVIIGAETGSGKTLAYLLPLFQKELNARERDPREAEVPYATSWQKYPRAVVLVPNKDLCNQAVRMGEDLIHALKLQDFSSGDGEQEGKDPIGDELKDSWEDSIDESAEDALHITGAVGSDREWPFRQRKPAPDVLVCTPKMLRQFVRNLDLFAHIETLVIDEADMLLDRGGYENDINEILVAFKRANRTLEYNMPTQFILSAATIPTMGLKSVQKFIDKRFGHAEYIRADLMHKHHPATKQDFIRTSSSLEDKVEAVYAALQQYSSTHPKSIVFTNTAGDAQLFAEALMEKVDDPLLIFPYHKNIPGEERDRVIDAFREALEGVLVCTDLGARGLDIPGVRHVIQGQFATNVVHHLHRIGRATRAGKAGRATNIFDSSNEDLVNAILDAGYGDLDHSFSRRRGFRKRVRRYGANFYKENNGE